MNNLITRALSGAVFVVIFSTCLYCGSWFWLGFLALLFILSQYEYLKPKFKLVSISFINILALFTIWFVISLAGHYYYLDYFANNQTLSVPLPAGYIIAFFLSIPVVLTLSFAEIKKKEKASIGNLQYLLFGFFFLGMGFLSLGFLRHNALMNTQSTNQVIIAFACVIGVWVSDTFAYLTGKMLGKNKLAPAISPNKTIEGLLGGMLFTIIFEVLFLSYFNDISSWYIALIFGIFLALISTLGDLVQSLWKRNMGIKDSGTILPGHGGILDRIDAQMLAAPFSLLYWVIINNFTV